MKHLLNCPVCEYTEIEGITCPNCDTDLSLIRLLSELPLSNPQTTKSEQPHRQPIARRPVGVALLILVIGIGLGAVSSFLFVPPQLLTKTVVTPPSQVATLGKRPTPPAIAQKPDIQKLPSQYTQYTVRRGDSLTAITEKFCGKRKSWQVMIKANPQIEGQENSIDVGEVLKVPNCKEG